MGPFISFYFNLKLSNHFTLKPSLIFNSTITLLLLSFRIHYYSANHQKSPPVPPTGYARCYFHTPDTDYIRTIFLNLKARAKHIAAICSHQGWGGKRGHTRPAAIWFVYVPSGRHLASSSPVRACELSDAVEHTPDKLRAFGQTSRTCWPPEPADWLTARVLSDITAPQPGLLTRIFYSCVTQLIAGVTRWCYLPTFSGGSAHFFKTDDMAMITWKSKDIKIQKGLIIRTVCLCDGSPILSSSSSLRSVSEGGSHPSSLEREIPPVKHQVGGIPWVTHGCGHSGD